MLVLTWACSFYPAWKSINLNAIEQTQECLASMAWNLHAIEQMRVDGVGRPNFDFHTGGSSRGPEAGEHAGPEEQGRAKRLERFTEEIRRTKQAVEESVRGYV